MGQARRRGWRWREDCDRDHVSSPFWRRGGGGRNGRPREGAVPTRLRRRSPAHGSPVRRILDGSPCKARRCGRSPCVAVGIGGVGEPAVRPLHHPTKRKRRRRSGRRRCRPGERSRPPRLRTLGDVAHHENGLPSAGLPPARRRNRSGRRGRASSGRRREIIERFDQMHVASPRQGAADGIVDVRIERTG